MTMLPPSTHTWQSSFAFYPGLNVSTRLRVGKPQIRCSRQALKFGSRHPHWTQLAISASENQKTEIEQVTSKSTPERLLVGFLALVQTVSLVLALIIQIAHLRACHIAQQGKQ